MSYRIPILGETVPLIDTSPPTPINDPMVGAHYHGSRPRYPGEGSGRNVAVRLRDLDAAKAWLQVWMSRAMVAFYRGTVQADRVCLLNQASDSPKAQIDGYEARTWPCEQDGCAIGAGVRD